MGNYIRNKIRASKRNRGRARKNPNFPPKIGGWNQEFGTTTLALYTSPRAPGLKVYLDGDLAGPGQWAVYVTDDKASHYDLSPPMSKGAAIAHFQRKADFYEGFVVRGRKNPSKAASRRAKVKRGKELMGSWEGLPRKLPYTMLHPTDNTVHRVAGVGRIVDQIALKVATGVLTPAQGQEQVISAHKADQELMAAYLHSPGHRGREIHLWEGHRNPSKKARKKVASRGDSFSKKYGTKAELAQRLWRYEARLANMLDDLDRFHNPGSGTALDKAYKKLMSAHTAVANAISAYDPSGF